MLNEELDELMAHARNAVKELKTQPCTAARLFAEAMEEALRELERDPSQREPFAQAVLDVLLERRP